MSTAFDLPFQPYRIALDSEGVTYVSNGVDAVFTIDLRTGITSPFVYSPNAMIIGNIV
jgi:hypothetical protein